MIIGEKIDQATQKRQLLNPAITQISYINPTTENGYCQ